MCRNKWKFSFSLFVQKIYIDLLEVKTNDNLTSFTAKETIRDINFNELLRCLRSVNFKKVYFLIFT